MRFLFLLIFSWSFCCFVALAQDVTTEARENDFTLGNSIFTNFWKNPAFAGAENERNFNLSSTWLWLGMSNKFPNELFFSFDGTLLKNKKIGLGGYFVFWGLPNFKTDLSVSSGFDITENTTLRIGLSISPFTQVLVKDGRYDTWGDQIHPRYGFIYATNESQSSSYKIRIIGSVRSGFWLSNPRFFAGISLENIHPYISEVYSKSIQYFDVSTLTIQQIAGYHFIFNKFRIIPVYSSIYSRTGGFYHGPGVAFSYQDKYFLVTSSDFHLGFVGITAGCLFFEKFRVMFSSAFYTNPYLHQITGTAIINLSLKYSM